MVGAFLKIISLVFELILFIKKGAPAREVESDRKEFGKALVEDDLRNASVLLVKQLRWKKRDSHST